MRLFPSLLLCGLLAVPGALTAQSSVPGLGDPCAMLQAGEAGLSACRDAVRRDPRDLGAQRRLGMLLSERGRHREARAAFEAVIRLAPDDADAHFDLARTLDQMGDRKGALRAYREYVRLDPAEPRGHQILGWAHIELGQYDEALRRFRESARLDPASAAAFLGAGMALAALERHEEALRSLRMAARLRPEDTEAWGQMAAAAAALGRPKDAVSYWERALLNDPGYFDVRTEERRRWERSIAAVGPQPAAALESERVAGPQRPASAGNQAPGRASVESTAVAAGGARTSAAPPRRRSSVFVRAATSSGSGFAVARDGYVLTNKHVIRGCTMLKVRPDSGESRPATVHALDANDDLALLKTTPFVAVARFREDPGVRPGDEVVAVGFPLSGLLADQVNVSTGSVNALAGLYNDRHLLQMSAPVQPGSSGGPLFDASGNVVGVVVTKLNAKVVAEETGDIPQNVNFAIKASVAREFLTAQGIAFLTAPSGPARSAADIGEMGRKVSVLVECWRD